MSGDDIISRARSFLDRNNDGQLGFNDVAAGGSQLISSAAEMGAEAAIDGVTATGDWVIEQAFEALQSIFGDQPWMSAVQQFLQDNWERTGIFFGLGFLGDQIGISQGWGMKIALGLSVAAAGFTAFQQFRGQTANDPEMQQALDQIEAAAAQPEGQRILTVGTRQIDLDREVAGLEINTTALDSLPPIGTQTTELEPTAE